MKSSLGRLALAAALVLAVLATAGTAQANVTPPGTNGKIAFASDRDNLSIDCSTVNGSVNDGSCGYEIYSMNPDGSGLSRLTNNTWKDDKPSWSPDGKQIAFESRRDCGTTSIPDSNNCFSNIYVMNADGSNVRQLTSVTDSATHPTWSPDGTKIAFERGDPSINEPDRIWVVPSAGGTPTLVDTLGPAPTSPCLSQDGDVLPAWSPDGTEIAFTRVTFDFSGLHICIASTNKDASTVSAFSSYLSGETSLSELASTVSPLVSTDQQGKLVTPSNFLVSAHTYVQNADGSGVANPIGAINGCNIEKLLLTQCVFDTNAAWAPDGAKLSFERNTVGCVLPIPICFGVAGQGVDDTDIVTTPRDGSGESILNANEPGNCGFTTDKNCFNDHKPAYAPENNRLAFHSDRKCQSEDTPDTLFAQNRGFSGSSCLTNIYTMNLLGTSVTGPLAFVADANDRNADWQPVFLAPTTYAFSPGSCSTDGQVAVGAAANSPGKGAVASVHYRIDGGAEQQAAVQNNFAVITVPNGQHTLTYFGVNQAGVAEAPHTLSVLVDTVNKCASAIGVQGVRSLASCAATNFNARFAVNSAVGVRQVRVFLDGKRIKTTGSSSFTVNVNVKKLKRGRHVLRTEVTDVNGRVVTSVRTFRACPKAAVKRPRRGRPRFTG